MGDQIIGVAHPRKAQIYRYRLCDLGHCMSHGQEEFFEEGNPLIRAVASAL
jgi:hypothetical protein